MKDLLGFQVVDKDNEIHPDMDASFCIYTLEDATEMFNQEKTKWRLLPIFEGDIEEPTLMFDDEKQLFTRSEAESILVQLAEHYGGVGFSKQDTEEFNEWMEDNF